MNQNVNIPGVAADEKICGSCGANIKIMAEICPKCGVRQRTPINKALLLVITFFLGGLGGHKFYTGRYWQGILYFLLCWTGIPGIVALIEFLIYAFTSTEKLQEKYTGGRGGLVIAIIVCGFVFIAIIGILAAIAIPSFVQFKNRAYQASVASELQELIVAEADYFAEHNKFSSNLEELQIYNGDPKITIEIISADEDCFEITGKHSQIQKTIYADCNGLK